MKRSEILSSTTCVGGGGGWVGHDTYVRLTPLLNVEIIKGYGYRDYSMKSGRVEMNRYDRYPATKASKTTSSTGTGTAPTFAAAKTKATTAFSAAVTTTATFKSPVQIPVMCSPTTCLNCRGLSTTLVR